MTSTVEGTPHATPSAAVRASLAEATAAAAHAASARKEAEEVIERSVAEASAATTRCMEESSAAAARSTAACLAAESAAAQADVVERIGGVVQAAVISWQTRGTAAGIEDMINSCATVCSAENAFGSGSKAADSLDSMFSPPQACEMRSSAEEEDEAGSCSDDKTMLQTVFLLGRDLSCSYVKNMPLPDLNLLEIRLALLLGRIENTRVPEPEPVPMQMMSGPSVVRDDGNLGIILKFLGPHGGFREIEGKINANCRDKVRLMFELHPNVVFVCVKKLVTCYSCRCPLPDCDYQDSKSPSKANLPSNSATFRRHFADKHPENEFMCVPVLD